MKELKDCLDLETSRFELFEAKAQLHKVLFKELELESIIIDLNWIILRTDYY